MELTPQEIATFRAETPGVEHVTHLNHAGSSLPTAATLAAQVEHLSLEARIGGYEAADMRASEEAAVYSSIASLVGADPGEIARMEHATAAWNAGFWSLPMQPGQRILADQATYGANAIGLLRAVELRSVQIDLIPNDADGQVDSTVLAERIGGDVALVALTHVPTNGGLVNPASAVGSITRQAGVPLLLDACQSVGQLDMNVGEIGCDMMAVTGRKYLRGPRGTGFLYVADELASQLIPDHLDHCGSSWVAPDRYELVPGARRFEHWEYSHAGWLALGMAAERALTIGLDRIEATIKSRAQQLRTKLTNAGHSVTDQGVNKCGIVTISLDDADAARDRLRQANINTSVVKPASTLFDSEARGLDKLLRLSVHYLTTEDELDQAVDELGPPVEVGH